MNLKNRTNHEAEESGLSTVDGGEFDLSTQNTTIKGDAADHHRSPNLGKKKFYNLFIIKTNSKKEDLHWN